MKGCFWTNTAARYTPIGGSSWATPVSAYQPALAFFGNTARTPPSTPVYRQGNGGETEVLLVKRLKGNQWALPGGFRDRGDVSAAAAARREACEETGLANIGGTDEVIMDRRSVGLRDTLHAWTQNTVVLVHGSQEYLHDVSPVAGDDAIDVGWFTLAQLDDLDMFDVHREYIDRAYNRLAQLREA